MTHLEALKQDLAELTERINSVVTADEDSVTLTRQKLRNFAQAIQNSTIEIKNYLGQIVLSSPFTSQINLSNLSVGMYFLTIQDKSNSKTVKIIKK